MALAALEGGMVITNSSVTLVHGMSRPIGALFHVPHGLSNAMLLTPCLTFAAEGAPGRFARLGREIGVAQASAADEDAAAKFIQAVDGLCRTCEIPTPEGYGILPGRISRPSSARWPRTPPPAAARPTPGGLCQWRIWKPFTGSCINGDFPPSVPIDKPRRWGPSSPALCSSGRQNFENP